MMASLTSVDPLLVQRLGWTLVHFAWQGLLLGAVTLGLLRILRAARPQVRYVLACAGLAVMLAAPVSTFVLLSDMGNVSHGRDDAMLPGVAAGAGGPGERVNVGANVDADAGVLAASGGERDAAAPTARVRAVDARQAGRLWRGAAAPESAAGDVTRGAAPEAAVARLASPPLSLTLVTRSAEALLMIQRALPWLVLVWSVGVALLLVRLCGGLLLLGRITHRTRPAQDDWQLRLIVLARQLNVRRAIALRECLASSTPAVIGWMRPVILLPASVLAGLTPMQVEAILAHELAHIRRHDYLVNLLQSIAETLLFYHPAVWLVSRQIRIEREHCCDDAAVEACGDAVTYATALAELERLRGSMPSLALAATDGSLLSRVQRLLTPAPTPGFSWPTAGALVISVCVLGCMVTLHGEPSGAAMPARAQSVLASRSVVQPQAETRTHALTQTPPPVPPAPAVPDAPEPPVRVEDLDQNPIEPPAPPAAPAPPANVHGVPPAAPAPPTPPVARETGQPATPPVPPMPPAPATRAVRGVPPAPPVPAAPPAGRPDAQTPPAPPAPPAAAPAAPAMSAPPPPPPPPPPARPSTWLSWLWGNDLPQSSYSISDRQGRRLAVLSRGTIELKEDDSDITRIDEGGYFKVEERIGSGRRRVELRARNGQLERRWLKNGAEVPYDEEAKRWLSGVLTELATRTGLGAEKRVARILAQRGPSGVVEAANAVQSDHVKRMYLDAALSAPALDNATLMRILATAPTIDSDFERAELLGHTFKRGLTHDQAKLAYLDAAKSIHSDFEKRRTLERLATIPQSSSVITSLLESAATIDSDFELAQVLEQVARHQTLDSATSGAFATAAARIDSAFERRRALTPLAQRPTLPPDTQAALLSSAAGISSDFERAELLTAVATHQPLTETARPAFFKAANNIDSSAERARTLKAVMTGQKTISDPMLRDVIGSTLTIGGDFERANVLSWVATHHPLTGPTRDAFMQASSKIDSEFERNRVLVALVRKDNGTR